MKKQISAIIAAAVIAAGSNSFAAELPNDAQTSKYKTAIQTLFDLNILQGNEKGEFAPTSALTRAEAVKIIVELMYPPQNTTDVSQAFSDVPGSHWAATYINIGVSEGFINGYDENTFGPDDNVTYAQAVKLLMASAHYTVDAEIAGGYPSGYISVAQSEGLTESLDELQADKPITREELAQLVYSFLEMPVYLYDGISVTFTGEAVPKYSKRDGNGEYYTSPLILYKDMYTLTGTVKDIQDGKYTLDGVYSRRLGDNYVKNDSKTYTAVMDSALERAPEKGASIKAYVRLEKDGTLTVLSYSFA